MLELALDLIFPKVCGMCGQICKESLCKVCGKEIEKQAIYKIDNYKNNKEKHFDEHVYIFRYIGDIRKKIIDYKFNDKSYLCEFFVKCILKNKKVCKKILTYDIIIPVPIHKKRLLQRGYNQSELIGKIISRKLGIQMVSDCLHKNENTIEQSKLNKLDRSKNVKNVYTLQNKEKIKDKNILIFDDIYTTGSTVSECARILKMAGTNKILVLTIAKD